MARPSFGKQKTSVCDAGVAAKDALRSLGEAGLLRLSASGFRRRQRLWRTRRMARPSFENRERPFVMRALQRRMPCEALAKQGFRMSLTGFAARQARRMARPSLKTTESALARYGMTAKDALHSFSEAGPCTTSTSSKAHQLHAPDTRATPTT